VNPIALPLVLTLILIVSYKSFFLINFKIIIDVFFSLDTPHGPPSAAITARHVGDLGNLTTDVEGNINLDMQDSIIQLYNSTQSIVNRSVVIHRYRDDGGEGGFPDSNTTGYDFVFI